MTTKSLRPMAASLLLLAQATFAAGPALAQSAYGEAQALDGDSLVVAGKKVRLFGIDAPEFDQQCQKDGGSWPCGEVAKTQLAELVAGQRVECRGQGFDQHGRILAVCTAGGESLNQAMVEQSWAVAYRQFSDAYISAELGAKTNRLGIGIRPSPCRVIFVNQSFRPNLEYRASRVSRRHALCRLGQADA